MKLKCAILSGLFLAMTLCMPVLAQEPKPAEPEKPAQPEKPKEPEKPEQPEQPAAPQPPKPKPPVAQPAKPEEEKEPDNTPPDPKKIDEAVKKGLEWLVKLQQKDGSFKVQYATSYPMGCTALVMLAMLKSGVKPRSPAIGQGFKYLEDLPLVRMYSVAIYVMALEALYAPSEKQMEKKNKPYVTLLRENLRKKSRGHDKAQIGKCIEWIISKQQKNVWRYPSSGEDLSNTQYALLALYSGMRMGYRISPQVFRKAADYMIVNQDKKGEEVKSFPVPAADFSLKDLRKLEKEIRDALKKEEREARKSREEKKPDMSRTTVIEDPYSRFGVERRSHKMFARGWSYTAPVPPKEGQKSYPMYCTGSMTTAGLASSVIIKAGLEGSRLYTKKYREYLDKCIRDGAAWTAKNFTVTTNPTSRSSGGSSSGSTHYLYYYLYGLERAGILTLCTRFGEHDWYNKGAKYIIEQQKKEGNWTGYKTPTPKPQPGQPPPAPRPPMHQDTCFALLFLKKATVPVVSIPPEIYTGQDLFGDKKEKEKKEEAPQKEGAGEKKEAAPAEKPEKIEKAKPGQPGEQPVEPEKKQDEQPAGAKKSFLGISEDIAAKNVDGAKVASVLKDSPADKAGIWEDDIVIEFDGIKIANWDMLRAQIANTSIGQKVKLKVNRSGAIVELELVISSKP